MCCISWKNGSSQVVVSKGCSSTNEKKNKKGNQGDEFFSGTHANMRGQKWHGARRRKMVSSWVSSDKNAALLSFNAHRGRQWVYRNSHVFGVHSIVAKFSLFVDRHWWHQNMTPFAAPRAYFPSNKITTDAFWTRPHAIHPSQTRSHLLNRLYSASTNALVAWFVRVMKEFLPNSARGFLVKIRFRISNAAIITALAAGQANVIGIGVRLSRTATSRLPRSIQSTRHLELFVKKIAPEKSSTRPWWWLLPAAAFDHNKHIRDNQPCSGHDLQLQGALRAASRTKSPFKREEWLTFDGWRLRVLFQSSDPPSLQWDWYFRPRGDCWRGRLHPALSGAERVVKRPRHCITCMLVAVHAFCASLLAFVFFSSFLRRILRVFSTENVLWVQWFESILVSVCRPKT